MLAPDLPVLRTAAPSSALAVHGGRLSSAREAFPDAPEPWIDLSTGINPHPYPVGELPTDTWHRLPDPAALTALERAAQSFFGAGPGTAAVAAPGTQALIQLLPRIRLAPRVTILGFGYQEHPSAWRAAGAAVSVVDRLDSLADADVAIVINPNNPDGRHVSPRDLVGLARRLADHDGLLIVDEAFAEVASPDGSLVPHLQAENVVVLRSFGKFFGLAGLRLGFALGHPGLCDALRQSLGPWAVSGPAIALGIRAFTDRAWQDTTREALMDAARRLDALLISAGFTILGGTALFRLGYHDGAPAIFKRLGRAGILVRPFAAEPSWLRFGLPADEAAWDRLADALPP